IVDNRFVILSFCHSFSNPHQDITIVPAVPGKSPSPKPAGTMRLIISQEFCMTDAYFPPDSYADPSKPYGNAPTLITLASIFNYIVAGIQLIDAIFWLVFAFFGPTMLKAMASVDTGRPATLPDLPPQPIFGIVYGGVSLLPLACGVLSFLAAQKLRKR